MSQLIIKTQGPILNRAGEIGTERDGSPTKVGAKLAEICDMMIGADRTQARKLARLANKLDTDKAEVKITDEESSLLELALEAFNCPAWVKATLEFLVWPDKLDKEDLTMFQERYN